MDVKDGQKAALGLEGIITQFCKFFNHAEKQLAGSDEQAKQKFLGILNKQIKIGKKLSHKALHLTRDIESTLSRIVELISNTNMMDDKFSAAKSGLKGASDLSEEATLQIGETAEKLQTTLEAVKKSLVSTLENVTLTDEQKAVVDENMAQIDAMGDDAFNIAVALQFQDILRQQLSAVGTILSNTKGQLAKTIHNLTGVAIETDEDEPLVTTDDTILSNSGGDQDDIDALINAQKS